MTLGRFFYNDLAGILETYLKKRFVFFSFLYSSLYSFEFHIYFVCGWLMKWEERVGLDFCENTINLCSNWCITEKIRFWYIDLKKKQTKKLPFSRYFHY